MAMTKIRCYNRQKICVLFALIIIVLLVFLITTIFFKKDLYAQFMVPTQDPWKEKHWNHLKVFTETTAPKIEKIILLWTVFFGNKDYIPNLHRISCPVSACMVTSNRELLYKSNAVLFHFRDINLNDLPKWRSNDQVWVLLNHESPPNTPNSVLKGLENKFNWTATYRLDSEIFLSPRVEKVDIPLANIPSVPKKTRMVAWLASNCKTPSKREDYVKELQKHLFVDVYGECGPLSCLPKMSTACYTKLSNMYRFYLSFENSICKDYVTEKFFNILTTTTMIPVVMGGANYSSLAPPHSYINTFDFKSPKDLARHLLNVAKDDILFNSYFQWKKTHRFIYEHYGCQLCKKLHENMFAHTFYSNISFWWFHDSNCKSWSA